MANGVRDESYLSTQETQHIGPDICGKAEDYLLTQKLQDALLGGVYEAKGLSSGNDFAVKMLHKSDLARAENIYSLEFCEVPLNEVRFADIMRGHKNVLELHDHFEDASCVYIVFKLARGGDLLEALKVKPGGFDDLEAQQYIQDAAKGIVFLHKQHMAMQDISLENMLLHIDEISGHYVVKVCDPGQAVVFDVDANGQELSVEFRGLVGKSFRPPELLDHAPYRSTKVDSWCLGWSTFYLLTAQPLFLSVDPSQHDADWELFKQGDIAALLKQKRANCSPTSLDFIMRLVQIDPDQRMTIEEALKHDWLTDPKIAPVLAPKKFLAETNGPKDSQEVDKRGASLNNNHPKQSQKADSRTASESVTISDASGMERCGAIGPSGIAHVSHSQSYVPQVRTPPKSPRRQTMRSPLGRRQRHPPHPRPSLVVTTQSPTTARLFPPPIPAPSSAIRGSHLPLRAASPMRKPSSSSNVAQKVPVINAPVRTGSPFRNVGSCSPMHRRSENVYKNANQHTTTPRENTLQFSDASSAMSREWTFQGDSRPANVVRDSYASTESFQQRMRQASSLPSCLMSSVQAHTLTTSATTPRKMSATTPTTPWLHNANGQYIWPGRPKQNPTGDRVTAGGAMHFPRSISPKNDPSRRGSPRRSSTHNSIKPDPKPTTPRIIRSLSPMPVTGRPFQPQMPSSGATGATPMAIPATVARKPSPPCLRSDIRGSARPVCRFAWLPQTPSPGTPSRSISPAPRNSGAQANFPVSGNFAGRMSLPRATSNRLLPKWPAPI